MASPASTRLDHSLDVPLTLAERGRIVVQLGSAMLGGALLAVGVDPVAVTGRPT